MEKSVNLPPELVYQIVSWFQTWKDAKSLLTCSVVSRQWYHLCTPFLWKTRALYDNENINFCLSYPGLLHFIRSLIVTGGPEWNKMQELVKHTNNVNKLRITRGFRNDKDFSGISKMISVLPQLTVLSFEEARFQFDPVDLLGSCLESSSSISSIYFKNCDIHLLYRSNSSSAKELNFENSKVKEFVCDGTTSFTDSLLMELMRTKMLRGLEVLSLEKTSISDWSMVNVIPLLSFLKRLNLVGTHVTDETIDCLTNNMQITLGLEELKLGTVDYPCIRVSTHKMHTLVMCLQNIRVLYLNGCGVARHITQHILMYRKHLIELDLGGSDIDQSIFDYLIWKNASCLTNLKFLGLSGCMNLVLECDTGSKTIFSPLSRFLLDSNVEHVDCSGIPRIRYAYIYGFRSGCASSSGKSIGIKGMDSCSFRSKELKRIRVHMNKSAN